MVGLTTSIRLSGTLASCLVIAARVELCVAPATDGSGRREAACRPTLVTGLS
jgi:hypothetical protein